MLIFSTQCTCIIAPGQMHAYTFLNKNFSGIIFVVIFQQFIQIDTQIISKTIHFRLTSQCQIVCSQSPCNNCKVLARCAYS